MTLFAPWPTSRMPGRPTYSCIRCADRKVKCDRRNPCSACVRHNADCVFDLSQPPRKKNKHVRDQHLAERLQRYEALLEEHGIDPDCQALDSLNPGFRRNHSSAPAQGESEPKTRDSNEPEPGDHVNKTQVVHGQGRSQILEKYTLP